MNIEPKINMTKSINPIITAPKIKPILEYFCFLTNPIIPSMTDNNKNQNEYNPNTRNPNIPIIAHTKEPIPKYLFSIK